MQVLVSDTSVLVDLKRGYLLEASFRLPFQFIIPNLLYRNELEAYGGERLVQLGLLIEELDDHSLTKAIHFRFRAPTLSVPDSFALALAQTRNWMLLTGDSALRELADSSGIECHGVLWIFNEIHNAALATAQDLHDGLMTISQHPRCRLPNAEVQRRLSLYADALP